MDYNPLHCHLPSRLRRLPAAQLQWGLLPRKYHVRDHKLDARYVHARLWHLVPSGRTKARANTRANTRAKASPATATATAAATGTAQESLHRAVDRRQPRRL